MTAVQSARSKAWRRVRRWAVRARRYLRTPELTVVVVGEGAAAVATLAALAPERRRRTIEVLLVNGSSRGRRRPGTRLVRAAPTGLADALRLAATVARTPRITFVDAGDVVTPGFVPGVLGTGPADSVVTTHVMSEAAVASVRAGEPLPARTLDRAELVRHLGSLRGVVLPTEAVRACSDAAAAVPALLIADLVCRAGRRLRKVSPRARAAYLTTPGNGSVRADRAPVPLASLLAALPALADLRPLTGPVVSAATEVVMTELRRWIDSDPRIRADVMAAVDAQPLLDPGPLVRGTARDLAVLYVALPFSDTSANIAARRVRELDRPVDVLTADFRHHRGTDSSAWPLWHRNVDERIVLPGAVSVQGDWPSTTGFCRDGAAAIAELESRKGPYRSVYSRTMFPASHLLAALYKIDHPDTPWLAEFSDPQLRDSRGGTRRSAGEPDTELLERLGNEMRAHGFTPPAGDDVWEWVENVTYALADTVLFTNEQQRDYMLGYCTDAAVAARAREHSRVSHHPAPGPELYGAADADYDLAPGPVHIGYFGTFYATRTLTEVLAALSSMDPAQRERLRLHVFTRRPDDLREEAAGLGLSEVVVANAYIPFLRYLALSTRLDVLLVNDYATVGHHEVNPYLPAKYSDYLGSGTAIWGIVEPGSVLSGMPLAHRSDLGDVAGAAAVLERLAADAAD